MPGYSPAVQVPYVVTNGLIMTVWYITLNSHRHLQDRFYDTGITNRIRKFLHGLWDQQVPNQGMNLN